MTDSLSDKDTPKLPEPKQKKRGNTGQSEALISEISAKNQLLIEELEDLKLLYEATIEHGEAVEDQLAEQSQRLEALSNQLAKYLSPQIYKSIFEGRQEVRIESTRKKLTVFFSDIEGFTETADRLESEDLTALLNHYLTEMSKIALKYGATIDKFIGDAILIFFGDPETKGVQEDALACVNMAIEMQARMTELQADWQAAGISKPLRCRIGIHTDYCTVGNFGSEDRLDYTIIGRGVNTASRLENVSEAGSILISYETYSQIKHRIHCKEMGEIIVKGMAYPISTYNVIAHRDLPQETEIDVSSVSKQLSELACNEPAAFSEEERAKLISSLKTALDHLDSSKQE